MATPGLTRADTWVIRATLKHNGTLNLGIWDKKTGGEADSNTQLYYPGNMADAEDLGGRTTTGNITLSRIYDGSRDDAIADNLLAAVGKGHVTVTQQALDQDGNAYGKKFAWTGRLKRVKVPDVDSESSSAAQFEIEVEVPKPPSAHS